MIHTQNKKSDALKSYLEFYCNKTELELTLLGVAKMMGRNMVIAFNLSRNEILTVHWIPKNIFKY